MAKIASELAKPDGSRIVEPGTEVALLAPMQVGVIPGVGPVTVDKLQRIGLHRVGDLQAVDVDELAQVLGRNAATALVALAHARDDRPVEAEREAKSISTEDTFERDLTDVAELTAILRRDAREVARRLTRLRSLRPHRHPQGAPARLLDPHPVPHAAERHRPGRGDRLGRARRCWPGSTSPTASGCWASAWPG